MKNLRDKISMVISEALPENEDNLAFCGNEDKYAEKGFYEMINKVMETITDHISQED